MEKNCENCRWYVAGSCRLPLYVDGIYYGGRELPKSGVCELYEDDGDGK